MESVEDFKRDQAAAKKRAAKKSAGKKQGPKKQRSSSKKTTTATPKAQQTYQDPAPGAYVYVAPSLQLKAVQTAEQIDAVLLDSVDPEVFEDWIMLTVSRNIGDETGNLYVYEDLRIRVDRIIAYG